MSSENLKFEINRQSTDITLTFLTRDFPSLSSLTLTAPFNASSKTVAETVVFIGTPSLLSLKENQ
jgi:hypothetical protein